MIRGCLLAGILAITIFDRAGAIEDETTPPTYKETPPTNSDIPNWNTGWAQPIVQPTGFTSTTGWNYVGSVDGNGAVYLGNGWVITAGHVGAGTFSLANVGYPMVPNSAHAFTTTGQSNSADLVLFQISPHPNLPALPLSSIAPTAYTSKIVMIGYGAGGGDRNQSWGYNTVTSPAPDVTQPFPITVNNVNYSSDDFWTITGTSSNGVQSATNNYEVIMGDSGGGDFIFNSASGHWELGGINEVLVTYSNNTTASGYVEMAAYVSQIDKITAAPADTPTLPQWGLIILGSALFFVAAPGAMARNRS